MGEFSGGHDLFVLCIDNDSPLIPLVLGEVRDAVFREAGPPVLVVRRGLRPGGLTPPEGQTRFTWSIAAR